MSNLFPRKGGPDRECVDAWPLQPIDYSENFGGPAWIRTRNQQIMSQAATLKTKKIQHFPLQDPAKSCKIRSPRATRKAVTKLCPDPAV